MQLGAVGKAQPDAVVPQLIELLKDFRSRLSRCSSLGRIGPPAKPAIPKLSEMLCDEDPNVRSAAMSGLVQMGPEGVRAVWMGMDEREMPKLAAQLASCLAQAARMLRAGMDPRTPQERETFEQLGVGSEHIDRLIDMAAVDDNRVAETAVFGLAELGEVAVPKLKEAAHDSRVAVRSGAVLALARGKWARTSREVGMAVVEAVGDRRLPQCVGAP